MLKNCKELGKDDITVELLRNSGKAMMKKLEKIIKKAWREEKYLKPGICRSYTLSTKKGIL